MPLSTGDHLGNYKIQSLIGKGGMGEVYLAIDIRLGRSVAIKVSSREFNDRFEREARAISTLNHPNICTLYDVGPNYLVMEHIEGDTLSKLVQQGQVPLEKTLAYAIQIVDALAAAHAKGVIHRDLKPGNIIITRNGVKVLDFGLAKLNGLKSTTDFTETLQTVTEPITKAGTVLGTLYYMAPEQVEGKETDERSDIFSFGVVLYEMITGQRPFTGDTQAAVLAALLKDKPPSMSHCQPPPPRALDRLVRKCLEKKPDDRWQSARDLKPALELIDLDAPPASTTSASVPIQSRPLSKSWLWPAMTGVLALALAAGGAYEFWPKQKAPERATRFQIKLPDNVAFNEYVSVSPDGHKLLFNSTSDQAGLWIHDLDTLSWRALPETRGARSPFWSPDSRFLGFALKNELKKIEIAGGPAQTLTRLSFNAGTGAWNQDGVIVFGSYGVNGQALWRVSSTGGEATPLTELDRARGERSQALPSFLPDGKHFVYLRVGSPEVGGIYVGSLDAKPGEQSKERILASQYGVPYIDGNLFFVRDGTLMTQPFDAKKLQLTGESVPVAEHVGAERSAAWFSVSPTGVLAFRSGSAQVGQAFQPTWFDAQGKPTGTLAEPRPDGGYTISPDATRVAVRDTPSGQNGDIWLIEFARGIRTRLTFRQSPGSIPVWSPDGKNIIFSAGTTGLEAIYEKASSGAGEERQLLKTPGETLIPASWSRDGSFLLYVVSDQKSHSNIWLLPIESPGAGERKPVLLLATGFNSSWPQFSPDGRWIAYNSNESGRAEVYVRPFDAARPALGEGKWQVSKDGGQLSRWRADGKQIVFRASSGAPMVADVNAAGAAFQAGAPRQLVPLPPGANGDWDVTPDFKRFLFAIAPSAQSPGDEPITVILNWKASLKH
ncbi:MAG TPA: protein kinase [Bryobacteraceae bacterium]|jgi:serine/threonine protein kinase